VTVADSAPGDAEATRKAERKAAAKAKRDAEAVAVKAHKARLARALRAVTVVTATLLVLGWALRPQLLRLVARHDPGRGWGAWAVRELAARHDAGSFDLYVRALGGPDDHEVFHRLVFVLGGRTTLPGGEDAPLAAEDPTAVAAHAAILEADLLGDDPVARRGALYALWALHDRPWAHTDALLAAAAKGLESDDPVTRRYAALVLKANPGPTAARAALARALGDPDGIVRKNAAEGLGNAGDAAAAPALRAVLRDPDADVRRTAMLSLARIGAPPPLDALEDLLHQEEPARRAEVLDAIALDHGPRATALLVDALHDPAAESRRAAAHGLGACPDATARTALEGALADEDPTVRVAAAAALSTRADGREAVPQLVAALPRHEGWRELTELHEALKTLTGAEIAGPGPEEASQARVVQAWQRWLDAHPGRAP
jgi:hypothetical protein